MAGSRSLWQATGLENTNCFGQKPVIAIANSFTQFVPGHIHLREVATLIAEEIHRCGALAREFNTIAVDDGIAMGHAGMLYSLPSREVIADSVEYMVNAHCADALLCLSNCDKITPGMLMAAFRLNIPTVFVSGGPMEAGHVVDSSGIERTVDLIDVIISSGIATGDDVTLLQQIENAACPTCGSCSGLFTANSMNCLLEALGLALPGNGSLIATHIRRRELFLRSARTLVNITKRYYELDDTSVLPKSIGSFLSFENAMVLDLAMGGSTNTVLHLLAAAHEADVHFTMSDVDRLSRKVPNLVRVSPANPDYHMEDVHRAGGVMAILGELNRCSLIHTDVPTVDTKTLGEVITSWDIRDSTETAVNQFYLAAPGKVRTTMACSQDRYYDSLDVNRKSGCVRDRVHAYSADAGLAVLYGNLASDGCIVKTAGVNRDILVFSGPAVVCESQEEAVESILSGRVKAGDVIVICYEGPKGGPGMQEMLYPTSYLKARNLSEVCALITDGRFSGGTSGLSIGHISPEAADGGTIALVQQNDLISINIPSRTINLDVTSSELERRRKMKQHWHPKNRIRLVSETLKVYAALVTSAAYGAVRDTKKVEWIGSQVGNM